MCGGGCLIITLTRLTLCTLMLIWCDQMTNRQPFCWSCKTHCLIMRLVVSVPGYIVMIRTFIMERSLPVHFCRPLGNGSWRTAARPALPTMHWEGCSPLRLLALTPSPACAVDETALREVTQSPACDQMRAGGGKFQTRAANTQDNAGRGRGRGWGGVLGPRHLPPAVRRGWLLCEVTA